MKILFILFFFKLVNGFVPSYNYNYKNPQIKLYSNNFDSSNLDFLNLPNIIDNFGLINNLDDKINNIIVKDSNELVGLYLIYSLIIDSRVNNLIQKFNYSLTTETLENFDLNDNLYMIDSNSKIIENIEDRKIWNKFLNTENNIEELNPGNYYFLHRNYYNYEEKFAICAKYFSIHKYLVNQLGVGKINILSNKEEIILVEHFILFNSISLDIKWKGIIKNNQIVWKSTMLQILNKTFINPQITQDISKYNWNITNINKNYLIFKRDIEGDNKRLIYYKK